MRATTTVPHVSRRGPPGQHKPTPCFPTPTPCFPPQDKQPAQTRKNPISRVVWGWGCGFFSLSWFPPFFLLVRRVSRLSCLLFPPFPVRGWVVGGWRCGARLRLLLCSCFSLAGVIPIVVVPACWECSLSFSPGASPVLGIMLLSLLYGS